MALRTLKAPRRLVPSVFSLARGTQLARRGHRLIERRRGAQKRVWSAYPFETVVRRVGHSNDLQDTKALLDALR